MKNVGLAEAHMAVVTHLFVVSFAQNLPCQLHRHLTGSTQPLPDVLEQLPPKKTGVCLLYCFVLSPLISLGAGGSTFPTTS